RESGRSSPASAVSARSAARRSAACRRPGVHGSASPRAQRSSSRQKASAEASQARSCATRRAPVASRGACSVSTSAQLRERVALTSGLPRGSPAARARRRRTAAPGGGQARPERRSYLDDDGEDHRPAAGAVVDELAEPVVQVLLEQLDLEDVVGQAGVEDLVCLLAHLLQEGP